MKFYSMIIFFLLFSIKTLSLEISDDFLCSFCFKTFKNEEMYYQYENEQLHIHTNCFELIQDFDNQINEILNHDRKIYAKLIQNIKKYLTKAFQVNSILDLVNKVGKDNFKKLILEAAKKEKEWAQNETSFEQEYSKKN